MRVEVQQPRGASMAIPAPVLAAAAAVLTEAYTWSVLYKEFTAAGAPGEAPEDSSKIARCMSWLRRVNAEAPDDALPLLGRLLHRFMEEVLADTQAPLRADLRDRMNKALAGAGLTYVHGGHITRGGVHVGARQLHELIRGKNLAAIEAEFETLAQRAAAHPRDALSAAANVVEAVLGEMIEAWNLTPPSDRSLNTLWAAVKPAINADPAAMPDLDLRKVVGAMAALVDGLQGLRDDKSRAHAMRPELARSYRIQPRHARLVVNAALALTVFLLETWDVVEKRRAAS